MRESLLGAWASRYRASLPQLAPGPVRAIRQRKAVSALVAQSSATARVGGLDQTTWSFVRWPPVRVHVRQPPDYLRQSLPPGSPLPTSTSSPSAPVWGTVFEVQHHNGDADEGYGCAGSRERQTENVASVVGLRPGANATANKTAHWMLQDHAGLEWRYRQRPRRMERGMKGLDPDDSVDSTGERECRGDRGRTARSLRAGQGWN